MSSVAPKSNTWSAGAFLSSQLDEMGLDPYEFRVYLHLCRRANDENRAWPSHATVAAVCKISEKKVREVLAMLRDKGLLTITNNFRQDGGKTSNSYVITGIFSPTPSVPRTDTLRHDVPIPPVPRTNTPPVPRTDKGIPVIDNVPEEGTSFDALPTEAPSQAPAAVSPKAKATRGTRIPADFTPSAEMVEWAKEKHPGVDLLTATDNFVDYWTAKAGAGATKADWAATWRVWIRTEAGRRSPSYAPKPTYVDKFADLERRHGQKLQQELAEIGYGGMP